MVINQRTMFRLDNFRKECQEAVENVKLSYLTNLGGKLHNPNTSGKFYWKIINTLLNKRKVLKFHLSLKTICLLSTVRAKLNLSLIFFPQQCKPVINDRFLPDFSLLINERIDQVPIESKDITSVIR